jgi:hypothetical protein
LPALSVLKYSTVCVPSSASVMMLPFCDAFPSTE